MKVLRVFCVENKYRGLRENRHDKRLEPYFSKTQKQRDFAHDVDPGDAVKSIRKEFGYVENGAEHKPFPDAFQWGVTELVDLSDRYAPVKERMFEEQLFSGQALASILQSKKARSVANDPTRWNASILGVESSQPK